jgi:hypothetical protein
MTGKSHYRTLRDHNAHRLGHGTHVGGGNVTTAESQRHIHLCGHGVELTARGKEDSIVTHDEPSVQLRQFHDGSAEIEIGDVAQRLRITRTKDPKSTGWIWRAQHSHPECE